MPVLELPGLYLDGVHDESGLTQIQVWNRDPAPGEPAVPAGWHIALDVVDPNGDGIDFSELAITVNGILAFDGSAAPYFQAGFNGGGSTYGGIPDGYRIRMQPTAEWASESIVAVVVFASTVLFTPAIEVASYSFTTEDLLAPELLSATAIGQKTVRLEFNEPVQVVDGEGFSFSSNTKPAVPVEPTGATASGNTVDVSLDLELTPGADYAITVMGIADLAGNSSETSGEFSGFVPTKPDGRRFELRDFLVRTEINSDLSGDLNYWIACLQDVLDLMFAELDAFLDVINLDRAPSPFLDLILADLGNPFSFELDDDRKRKFASLLVGLYKQSGTAIGVENAIRFFVGVEASVLPYVENTWILGVSLLNEGTILAPSGQRELYSFIVEVSEPLTSTQRAWIYEIARFMKPAHTHLEYTGEGVVEPAKYPGIIEVIPTEFWVLDESELDETTILES